MPHLIASLIMAYTPMIGDKWTYYNCPGQAALVDAVAKIEEISAPEAKTKLSVCFTGITNENKAKNAPAMGLSPTDDAGIKNMLGNIMKQLADLQQQIREGREENTDLRREQADTRMESSQVIHMAVLAPSGTRAASWCPRAATRPLPVGCPRKPRKSCGQASTRETRPPLD